MLRNQARLWRLQLLGTLLIIFLLAMTLATYFLLASRTDYHARQQQVERDAYQHARAYLQSSSEQTSHILLAMRSRAREDMRQQLRVQVDQAYLLAERIWEHEHQRLPAAEVQALIVTALRPLRFFDGRGYFFIDTMDGRCVLLPTVPGREGSSLLDNRDDQGHYIMQTLIASVRGPQAAGFSTYRWYLPGTRQMADKIAYARHFAPYDWLIGSGEYLANVEAELQQQALTLLAGSQQSGDKDDLMVIDERGVLRLYLAQPDLQGKHYQSLPEPLRSRVQEAMQLGSKGGYLSYSVPQPDKQQAVSHLAYVHRLPGWNWTLINAMHMQSIQVENQQASTLLEAQLLQRIKATVLITLLAMGCASLLYWFFNRWINALLARYQDDLRRSHAELQANSRELKLSHFMIDHATDMVLLQDSHGTLVYANRAARDYLEQDEAHHRQLLSILSTAGDHALPHSFETRLENADGHQHLEVTLTGLAYQDEHYLCATARDISQRHHAARQQRLAARVFESSNEAILITSADNRILAVNHAFTQITGYSEQDVLGRTPALLASGQHNADFYQQMWHNLSQRGQWSGEIWNRRKNGETYPEWLNISVLTDEQGNITHHVALFSDISERKAHEARIQHLAEFDALTDLPNRILIHDRLQQAIRQAERLAGKLAVLFVDLDHFKNINDTLGHNKGDELLKQVASRLCGAVRELDTVGRTGGDEFVLILPAISQPDEAAQVAERILRAMQTPFDVSGASLVVGCSIGISLLPDDGQDIQTLLMNADLAMYHAKSQGRNTFRFYTREMNSQVAERLQLENRLRHALEQNELFLLFQPQYDINSHALIGCEALVRWQHPTDGLIMPSRFIPIAEDSGLIVQLGRWVMHEACQQMARWQAQGLPLPKMAVNVSARQLARTDFIDDVRAALQASGLPGHYLEIEVTESTLMEDADLAARQLSILKAMGVRLSVDDFGTGYSSLAYLKRFAPDTIKIDRSFVCELPGDSEDAAIVSAIIHLARALGMNTLAEGVETDAQHQYLRKLGCGGVQGYLLGRPQTASKLESQFDATV